MASETAPSQPLHRLPAPSVRQRGLDGFQPRPSPTSLPLTSLCVSTWVSHELLKVTKEKSEVSPTSPACRTPSLLCPSEWDHHVLVQPLRKPGVILAPSQRGRSPEPSSPPIPAALSPVPWPHCHHRELLMCRSDPDIPSPLHGPRVPPSPSPPHHVPASLLPGAWCAPCHLPPAFLAPLSPRPTLLVLKPPPPVSSDRCPTCSRLSQASQPRHQLSTLTAAQGTAGGPAHSVAWKDKDPPGGGAAGPPPLWQDPSVRKPPLPVQPAQGTLL